MPTQTQGSSAQPFQFTGEQRDGNGLIYLRARYDDPAAGRFLSRDALTVAILVPESVNRLTYARDNPVLVTDPSGRCANWFSPIPEDYECLWIDPALQFSEGAGSQSEEELHEFGGAPEPVAIPQVEQDSYRIAIGKMKDLRASGALMPGERELDLPDLGDPQSNWAQNAGKLRAEMRTNKPIRDVSVNPDGTLRDDTGFLRAERNLLRDRGWVYDPHTTLWYPPQGP